MTENSGRALTLDERRIIEYGIRKGSTKTAIAQTIGKDKSTIGKEIRLHRVLSHRCSLPRECSAYKKCSYGRECTEDCPGFVPFSCSRRDRSPGACNGCPSHNRCRFNKYTYRAADAEREYRETLSGSRRGVNLTVREAKEMASVIGPLLSRGLSPYQIITLHPELGICEKTLYSYIQDGVFSVAGILDIDLRRKTSRRLGKQKAAVYKKREDRSFLRGRLYTDYQAYMRENPPARVLQMDTVYNDGSAGPFLQTFRFIGTGLLFAVYHDTKTARDMVEGLELLESILGRSLFGTFAEAVLTDRGPEFSAARDMEMRPDGSLRCRVFYCDPMQSGQKGSLEVCHELLRYILPKGTDLRTLGLSGQDALFTVLSHINSAPVESLHGKSPIAYTRFFFPELWERLAAAGLREIPEDSILLRPYLLKDRKGRTGEGGGPDGE